MNQSEHRSYTNQPVFQYVSLSRSDLCGGDSCFGESEPVAIVVLLTSVILTLQMAALLVQNSPSLLGYT